MNWIRNQLRSGWPILIIFTFGLMGYFIYMNYLHETLNQIYRAVDSIENARLQLQNIQEYVDDFNASRSKISDFLPMLFPVDEPQALIDDLKSKAVNRGGRLADVQLDVPKFIEVRKNTDPVSIVPFKASFHGDFISLGKILVDLEEAPYVQTISEVNLTNRDDSGTRLLMSIKGALRFFDNDLIDRQVNNAA